MGLSRKLYQQVLLTFKPTEAISSVLDLNFSLFTDWVIIFEPLVASSHVSHAAGH